MSDSRIYNNALEISKFVCATDEAKLDILAKYGLMADIVLSGSSMELIRNNMETFKPLMSENVIKWVMTEKGKPLYTKAIGVSPRIATMFSSEGKANDVLNKIAYGTNVTPGNFSSYDDVILGNSLFGVEKATPISSGEAELNTNTAELGFDVDFDNPDELFDLLGGTDGEDEIEIEDNPEIEDDLEIEDDTKIEDAKAELLETAEPEKVTNENVDTKDVPGYNEKIHGGYRRQIEKLILSAWEDLYGYHVDGKEIVDGFIVPGGSVKATGEDIRYEGVLTLNSDSIVVKPSTMSNAIHEEFLGSCLDCGIDIVKEVSDDETEVRPFKYNPMLQRKIASGGVNKEAFKLGWVAYSQALAPYIIRKTKELSINRAETGSDEEIFKALSGYIISLMVVNYKDELGTQLRVCCGDTSKTKDVASRMVLRLRSREKTHKSIAQGKLIVGDSVVSENGLSATITIYQNMAGYQAVPQFMGELLCNLSVGMFKPSLKHMIIGVDLKNNIVTAPFTKWLIPIIAGSRSGKGVLTLNMLLNVIGGGTPLYYLDGKPDMAALLWKLQAKYNIPNSMVVDGIGYQGVTEVDKKPFRAPYADNLELAMKSETADEIMAMNYGAMIYLKTMLVILLSCRYYKDRMGSCYGDIFVVFDEMFKVMKIQTETLVMNIDTAIAKLDKSEKPRKDELTKIKMWITELLQTYIGNDIGVFGAGIKAVALSQFAQDGQYTVNGFTVAKTFCTNFLLKRGVKLFGRQEGGSGIYGVVRDKNDEIKFDLYDKYFHFGVGSEQSNNYNTLKTFKPLLVLNENDCKELTGEATDGAFVSDMLSRVAMFSDVEQFRQKYFTDKDLAESIGFEGALAQVGRLLGVNWQDMLAQSYGRAYEISDKALRYYNIIGIDNIANVHDFICSMENKHLWSYNEIIRAHGKGVSLGSSSESGEDSEQSVFGGEQEEGIEDFIDFGGADGIEPELKDTREEPVNNTGNGAESFGGSQKSLSAEELRIMREIEIRKNNANQVITEMEEPQLDADEIKFDSDVDEYTEEEEPAEVNGVEPRPYEDNTKYGEPVYSTGGKTGKTVFVNPSKTSNTMRLTEENSIQASLDENHPLEKYENLLFKSLKGSRYQFEHRWGSILNSVSKKIDSNLITRVMLVQDEMYVNGRLISMTNIVGGFENIRLEDLVSFKTLFKKFKNINEITLDMTMVERFQIEQPNLPNGFFAYSPSLMKVNIILENGTKQVIDKREQAVSAEAEKTLAQAKLRNQFAVMSAANNPRLRDMSPGYQSKVWDATKSFGGRGWEAMTTQLTKQNPSFVKAVGIGLITGGIMAFGGAMYGIGSLFKMFRR